MAELASGMQPSYLFFWGNRPRKAGVVDKSCFSQWYPSRFEHDADVYMSAEHYMMAEKARLFGDFKIRDQILQASDPAAVKALGREVHGFESERWETHRMQVVVQGNTLKFAQNLELSAFLLGTGNQVLVEASPVDNIWGIGLAADAPEASQPEHWRGLNLLGFALMEVRGQLESKTPNQ